MRAGPADRPLLPPNPVASAGQPGQNECSTQVRPTSHIPPRRSSGMEWLRLLLAAAVLLGITAISNADYILIRYSIGGKKTDPNNPNFPGGPPGGGGQVGPGGPGGPPGGGGGAPPRGEGPPGGE